MPLVRLDDLRHQRVADDVGLVEVDERDAVDSAEHILHRDEPRDSLLKIDLSDVPGDDGLRVEAEPREEHLHLRRRRVLRLVEEHEAVVERAAAHERQRRHLDLAVLEQFLELARRDHVEHRVVERAQVRTHLGLDVPREESEFLARLDGGAREDDSLHLLPLEIVDRLGDREVRLARAGRPDREHDVAVAHGLHVSMLSYRLRADLLTPMGDANDVGQDRLHADAGLDLLDQIAHVGRRRTVILLDQREQLLEQRANALDLIGIALDADGLAPRDDLGGKRLLDLFKVAVVLAEKRGGFRIIAERDLRLNRLNRHVPLRARSLSFG